MAGRKRGANSGWRTMSLAARGKAPVAPAEPSRWETFLAGLGLTAAQAPDLAEGRADGPLSQVRAWVRLHRRSAFVPEEVLAALGMSIPEAECDFLDMRRVPRGNGWAGDQAKVEARGMTKAARDWTRTGTIVAMADWLRRESGALAVIVMRGQDGALAVDEAIAPRDVEAMMCAHLTPLVEDLGRAREEKRGQGARARWEEMG